jgi:hypothetical protein
MLSRAVIVFLTYSILSPAVGWANGVVGRGDFEFFLDSAVFRMSDGSSRQDVYVRVPNASVRFKRVQGKHEARPRLSILIRDSRGEKVVKESEELRMYADTDDQAADTRRFQTLTKSFPLGEGVYTLFCSIEDRYSPKMTIMGMVKDKYKESIVSGYPLEVPTFPEDKMSLSDARFLWTADVPGDERTYAPNPTRVYGLYRDSLRVYVEAYIPRLVLSSEDLEFKTVILDEKGEKVTTTSVNVPIDDASRLAFPRESTRCL